MPSRLATCQMVSPGNASTSLPSSVNFTDLPEPPVAIVSAFRLSSRPSNARAGTHSPRPVESARRMGPRLRGDDPEYVTPPRHHQLPNGLVSSSGKYLITHSSGFGA